MGSVVIQSLFVLIAVTAPAYAYVDPGAGSMLLQLILGSVAGALIVLKLYWSRVKALFSRGRARPGDASATQAAVAAEQDER